MTETAIALTDLPDSAAAGRALGGQIAATLAGAPPDALIVFVSPRYDYEPLLAALEETCRPRLLVGSSSAGEFTGQAHGEGLACAVALRSTTMQFAAALGRGLRADRAAAARDLVAAFRGATTPAYPYRSALVLTDALAGHADDLVEHLTLLTAGTYQFFGGGAGDDGLFRRTHVFYGTAAYTDAAVALEILSEQPLGVGVAHGWQPASEPLRVTEAEGMRVVSLNATPAVEVFAAHAERTGQPFDPAEPLPFFLHNLLGIETGQGYQLRVPLAVEPDGAVTCAAEIPVGATVRLMGTSGEATAGAAAEAVRRALAQLGDRPPKAALFFDCVATRLRMGKDFGFELRSLERLLGSAGYAGYNTYGQIARAEGQFSGFHNCTAVVCVISE
ncbi:MAG TPA: FIST N-terminal domain-containing protein [Thermomicrobiales bacterium]|nr:FIST N-terminal domain-containing protein [Thermomicrobiales bacterium]